MVAESTGFDWQKVILPALPFRVEELKGFGFNLAMVYLICVYIITILYPLGKKFGTINKTIKINGG